MRLFIACNEQQVAKDLVELLRLHDHTTTSRWVYETPRPFATYSELERTRRAFANERDVTRAQAVIYIVPPGKVTRGRIAVVGIALGQGKPVFILGRRDSLMLYHPLCSHFEDPSDLLAAIAQLHE